MLERIKKILQQEGITRVGIISINNCDIINERILPKETKSVIMFCIPYRSVCSPPGDGFSEYSRIYDYHKYSSMLFDRCVKLMSETTGHFFKGFCDHSPINEKLAAAKCGLGIVGRNSLFIDNVYGSFVFLASIATDIECKDAPCEVKLCNNCGLCVEACPGDAILEHGIDRYRCLSGISQKKIKTQDEIALLKEHNIVWGCDICQLVCPHNVTAKISPIKYFKETRIEHIDKEFLLNLSEEEFEKYAFSYKGRNIVLNNIDFK